tara:strand:+ start:649 stop:1200 length:552 start_codon:yes stop_codon:yes gene_type:complete
MSCQARVIDKSKGKLGKNTETGHIFTKKCGKRICERYQGTNFCKRCLNKDKSGGNWLGNESEPEPDQVKLLNHTKSDGTMMSPNLGHTGQQHCIDGMNTGIGLEGLSKKETREVIGKRQKDINTFIKSYHEKEKSAAAKWFRLICVPEKLKREKSWEFLKEDYETFKSNNAWRMINLVLTESN